MSNSKAIEETAPLTQDLDEQGIAELAYELWQARGCPEGTPEEDWFRAIEELQSRNSQPILSKAVSG